MKALRVEICVGTSCRLLGSQDLFDAVQALPAGKRERIDLDEAACFKNCRKGPSVRIDGIVLPDMTPDRLMEIIEDRLL